MNVRNVGSGSLYGLGVIALTVALSACGSSDSAPAGQSGRLVQGPVLGATVFADNVTSGVRFAQDAGEVSTTTSATTGDFTLPSVPGYNYILVSKGGTDKLTGAPAIQMLAPAGSANVSPLTTLVALDTTGTVKAKLEALMPAGVKFDADLSVSASPAILLVSKSIEGVVQSMTTAVTTKAGSGVIPADQLAVIQAQTMQAIAGQFASTGLGLATTANLTTVLQAAVTTAVANIHTASPSITIPVNTATGLVTSAVTATNTALSATTTGGVYGTGAITGGETTALATTGTALGTAVNTAGTAAAATTIATAGSFTTPTIPVVTPVTVPGTNTGTSGGNSGGTGNSF